MHYRKLLAGLAAGALVLCGLGECAVAEKTSRFTDYGAPARVSAVFSNAAGLDKDGHPVLFQARGQAPEPFYLLMTRIDTGETKQFNSKPSLKDCNYPWGMRWASNGRLYIGTCTDGQMFEFDPKTETLKELGHPSDTETYIWDLAEGSDGKIYGCTYGNCKLVRYDPASGKLDDLGRADEQEEYLRSVEASKDGYVYAGIGTSRAGLTSYNISTGKFTMLVPDAIRAVGMGQVFMGTDNRLYATCPTTEGEKSYIMKRGEAIEIPKDMVPGRMPVRFADGRELQSISDTHQTITMIDPKTKKVSSVPFKQEPAGTTLFVLTVGPDQKVYISSILPLYLCSLDPKTGETHLFDGACYGAEVYSFQNLGNRLWMAAYTGCSVAAYDVTKPWNPGEKPENNPQKRQYLSNYAHRPYRMCIAPDGKNILIGGIPDYGLLGGSIVVLNPDTFKVENEYRNIIPNQSILGLCVTKEGLVCGSTGIGGGGGSHVTEKDAKLFLWDYTTHQKVFDMIPVPGAGMISDLTRGPDDLIYGFAGDTLIVFDPASRKLVHSEKLPYGGPCFNGMALAPNGKFIALLGNQIVEITPGTFQHRSLAKYDGGITAGIAIVNKNVYFGSRSHVIGFEME